MSLPEPDITLLLSSLSKGDGEALGHVMTLVYRELHAIAARHMRRERRDHTLRTTALVIAAGVAHVIVTPPVFMRRLGEWLAKFFLDAFHRKREGRALGQGEAE